MPIYEYRCEHCGETLEELQKFSDQPLTTCPHCGGHLDKLMSLNSFSLKGTGWYVTDYKGKNASHGPECPHGHEKTEPAKAICG